MIDTRTDGVAATIDVSLTPDAREGAMPDGLTASPDGKRLYVALAGENALAVIDVARRRVIGFIPTAWYPVDVDITRDGSQLVVTGANRVGDKPNRCAGPYAVGDCSSGDLIYADIAADRLDADDDQGRRQRDRDAAHGQAAAPAHAHA